MKMRKILAALSASVVAVSALSIVASADDLMTKTGNEESATKYALDFSGLTEDQVKSIVKIEAKVSVTSNMVNGCIGFNSVAEEGWFAENQETKEDAGPVDDSTWSVTVAAGDLAAVDEDGNLAPSGEVQFWWVNPLYDDEGEETGDGTATLKSVTFYDAAGNAVVAGAAADPATSDPATSDPATSDPATGDESGANNEQGKPNTSTGIEGVAAVLGVAVVAAGAMVVAKKRK